MHWIEVLFIWSLTNYSPMMKKMDMSLLGFYQREERIQRE